MCVRPYLCAATECLPLKNGDQYLRADFRIRCDDDTKQYELFGLGVGAPAYTYSQYRDMATVMIILYPVGVIALFLWVLGSNANRLYDDTLHVTLEGDGRLLEDVPVTKVESDSAPANKTVKLTLKRGDKVWVAGEPARGTVLRVNKAFDSWYTVQDDAKEKNDATNRGAAPQEHCCASKDSTGKLEQCHAKAYGKVSVKDEFGNAGPRCYFHKGRRTRDRKDCLRSELIDERFFLKRWYSHVFGGYRVLPAGAAASFAASARQDPGSGSARSCCTQKQGDRARWRVVQRMQRSDCFPVNSAMMDRFGSLYAGYTARCYWWGT